MTDTRSLANTSNEAGWVWGGFYQLLDVKWAEESPGSLCISPAICRIDRLMKSVVHYNSSSLQLTFSVPREDADVAFAECQVFRPENAASYQAESQAIKNHGARYYPEKHVMKGNILVSCTLLGSKVLVLQNGPGRALDLIETETGEGGEDLRPFYTRPSEPYKFEAICRESLTLKPLPRWSIEELRTELEALNLKTEGNATCLMLRLQAASIRSWFGMPQDCSIAGSLGTRTCISPGTSRIFTPSIPTAGRPTSMHSSRTLQSESSWRQSGTFGSTGSKGRCSSTIVQRSAGELRELLLSRYGLISRSGDRGSLTRSLRSEHSETAAAGKGGDEPSQKQTLATCPPSFKLREEIAEADAADSGEADAGEAADEIGQIAEDCSIAAVELDGNQEDQPRRRMATFIEVVEELASSQNLHLPLRQQARETAVSPSNRTPRDKPDLSGHSKLYVIGTKPSPAGSWGMFESLLGAAPEVQSGRCHKNVKRGGSTAADKPRGRSARTGS